MDIIMTLDFIIFGMENRSIINNMKDDNMNVYDLIELYNLWKGEKYVNKNTYEILEEKEYLELSK